MKFQINLVIESDKDEFNPEQLKRDLEQELFWDLRRVGFTLASLHFVNNEDVSPTFEKIVEGNEHIGVSIIHGRAT